MQDIITRFWDVIVIGTGIGGGTAGRRLAEAGLSVLFIEKGPDFGDGPSEFMPTEHRTPSERLDNGAWPYPLEAELDGAHYDLEGMIGAGVGGTSLYYAATLERPERHDIDNSESHPHPTGGWPISYDEMKPYFAEAERNFHISGEPDPLDASQPPLPAPPRALPASDAAIIEALRRTGMHPYQTHMAARFVPGCENCFGRRCPRRCKMDGRRAGVLPALETGNAKLIDRCSVVAIDADSSVKQIRCRRDGQEFTLTARSFVLAAGGLGSPALLLNSRNDHWPEGVGNQNDLVGRNLMFHLSEIIAIWPGKSVQSGETGAPRSISLRDLYYADGQRFGTVQSMGLTAGFGEILHAMRGKLELSPLRRIKPLRLALRIPAAVAVRVLGNAKLFVGVLEDLPYPDNRLLRDDTNPERLRISYVISDELKQRRARFRKALQKAFKQYRTLFMGSAPQLNFAHPCGTLRFGTDPRTSVLDPDCRVHGVDNLYVADSSFMPTSNGVNPSLTIAANALRVADIVAADLRSPLAAADGVRY